ncbi:unnamed protein product, partial [Citrullus colocynthis]
LKVLDEENNRNDEKGRELCYSEQEKVKEKGREMKVKQEIETTVAINIWSLLS